MMPLITLMRLLPLPYCATAVRAAMPTDTPCQRVIECRAFFFFFSLSSITPCHAASARCDDAARGDALRLMFTPSIALLLPAASRFHATLMPMLIADTLMPRGA